jgi:hypothetical protein
MVIMGYGVPLLFLKGFHQGGPAAGFELGCLGFVAVVEQVGHDVGPIQCDPWLVVGGDVGEGRGAAVDLALLLLEHLAVEISVRGEVVVCVF